MVGGPFQEAVPGQERKSVVFSEPEAEVRLAAEPEVSEGLGPTPTQVTDQVTSCATSTTSIDGGYQGDSEFDTGTVMRWGIYVRATPGIRSWRQVHSWDSGNCGYKHSSQFMDAFVIKICSK